MSLTVEDWNAWAAVRALRRDLARRRREQPSIDQMVIFLRRQRLARQRSCLGALQATAGLRDVAQRFSQEQPA